MIHKRKILLLAWIAGAAAASFIAGRKWAQSEAAGPKQLLAAETAQASALEDGGEQPATAASGAIRSEAGEMYEVSGMGVAAIIKALDEMGSPSYPQRPDWQRRRDLLLDRLAEIDPELAAELTLELSPAERIFATSRVLDSWARRDPDSAWNWLNENVSDPILLEGRYSRLFSSFVRSGHSDFAISRIGEMPDGYLKDRVVRSISADLSRYEPEKFLELLEALPEGDLQTTSLGTFARTWAGEDPRAAADWAWNLPVSGQRTAALDAVMGAWAQSAPEASLEWVKSLPFSPDTDSIKQVFANRLDSVNPISAFDLSLEIQEESLRLRALRNAALHLGRMSDPEEAIARIERLPPGPDRERVAAAFAGGLYSRDAAHAEDFVRSSPLLSDERRAEMLKGMAQLQN